MIGSNQVPGVLPLACNSVTGSTDLSYRLVHNNTQQQPEFEILTRDWPVYSRTHTDEATVGQKVLELAEGRREYWKFGRKGRQKANTCGWLLYVVVESSR